MKAMHGSFGAHLPVLSGKVQERESWWLRELSRLTGHMPVRFELWDGRTLRPRGQVPIGTVRIGDRATLLRVLLDPELQFGEAYTTGRIEVQGDLVRLLELLFRGRERASARGRLQGFCERFLRPVHENTLGGSRHNVHQHYDLGNSFYRLWLDQAAMQYTCAYFGEATATLEEAQQAKMDLICRKLWLRPGETVVEAGCGWGGLALYMARQYGVRVRAYNISHEQVAYARAAAQAAGLAGQVEYLEDDYRHMVGDCDAFVSVGMLEHVGPAHYRELGRTIDRVLRPEGRGLIHSIGRNVPQPMNAWIDKRIFPGAQPPTLRQMMNILEPSGFSVLDVENLRLHYATTLQHWLQRFEQHESTIAAMFDPSFVRAWRLYLCGSIAAFTTGHLQLFQVLFNRAGDNHHPLGRERLYRS